MMETSGSISSKNPFNIESILETLFELSSVCPYEFSTTDLLSFRSLSSKTFEIGKPFVYNQIGILEFDFFPRHLGLTNFDLLPPHPTYNIFTKTHKQIPPSPFKIKNLIITWFRKENYINPDSIVLAEFANIVRNYGSAVSCLVWRSFADIAGFVNASYYLDADVFSKLTNISEICLTLTYLEIQRLERSDYMRTLECEGVIPFAFKQLNKMLPNPNGIRTISIYFENGQEVLHKWTILPKQLFNLHSSLQNLYYSGIHNLGPEFLERDKRIQFVRPNSCSFVERNEFVFEIIEFDKDNDNFNILFKYLVQDISDKAIRVSIKSSFSEIGHLENWMLNSKWSRLISVKCSIGKGREGYAYSLGKLKKVKLCSCEPELLVKI